MKSIEWIDQLIEARNLPSDRQAALLIGMQAPTMSQHRNGKSTTLDDKYAYRLEALLGLEHGTIVADQHAERETDPYVKAMWLKLGKLARLPEAAALGIMAICLAGNATEVNNPFITISYVNVPLQKLKMAISKILSIVLNNSKITPAAAF